MNSKVELGKPQIIALVIVALILTYFLTGVLTFALNHAIKLLKSTWTLDFTIKAMLGAYPQVYKAFGISLFVSFAFVFILPFIPKKEKLHGDAKFASSADIRKLGLYPKYITIKDEKGKNKKVVDKNGIIIGKHNGQLLRFGGQQFVALGAPTRSGKGVGIVIPNLLDYPNSCVVQDIKQECFEFTSKYRKEVLGQEVFLFNPFSKQTHCYNPLHYIDMGGDNADEEITNFANILYPLKGDGSVTDYFNGKAKDLFVGLAYLMHDLLGSAKGVAFMKGNDIECSWSIYGIFSLSTGLNFAIEDSSDGEKVLVENFADTYNFLLEINMVSKKAKENIDLFMNIKSENEQSSAMGSFISPLSEFKKDNMKYATSSNDFDFRDLRRKKMTIYIGITPDNLASAKQVLNIFWQQLILVNVAQGLPQSNKELKHPCLLLMDEFTASGYLPTYSSAISFMAGYDLRSLIIYQANSQLMNNKPEGYGQMEGETLLTNHACQIFYAPRLKKDAENLSGLLGTKTIKNRSRNLGSGGGGSESDTSRALMLEQELRSMDFKKEIITIDNGRPILANKAFYYNDRYFMDKFKEVSPSLAKIKGIPNRKQLESAIQNGETKIDVPFNSEEKMQEKIKSAMEELFKKFNVSVDKNFEKEKQEMKNMSILVEQAVDDDFDEENYRNFEVNERTE